MKNIVVYGFDLYGRVWNLLGDIFCFILCKNEKKVYDFRNDEIVCGNVFNYCSGDKYIIMCMVVCTRSQEVE